MAARRQEKVPVIPATCRLTIRDNMPEILQYEFMQHALTAGLLVSVVCGIIGVYVVVNRLVFISGGIAHTAFGGVGMGFFLGINPMLGALIFALGSAVGIGVLRRQGSLSEDATIGILWAIGMAVGVILIGLTPGYVPGFSTFLFGNILIVSAQDVRMMLMLAIVIVLSVVLLYKPFFAFSLDRDFAEVKGLPVNLLYLFLLGLIALSVIVMMKIVGIVLVIALLTIPAAIVRQFVHDMKIMMAGSVFLSVAFTLTGLYVSYLWDLASGATIVIVAGVGFVISLVFR